MKYDVLCRKIFLNLFVCVEGVQMVFKIWWIYHLFYHFNIFVSSNIFIYCQSRDFFNETQIDTTNRGAMDFCCLLFNPRVYKSALSALHVWWCLPLESVDLLHIDPFTLESLLLGCVSQFFFTILGKRQGEKG